MVLHGPAGFCNVSSFKNGVMSILCSNSENCRDLSNHYLDVNTGVLSIAFASRLGTVFRSAVATLIIKNSLQFVEN